MATKPTKPAAKSQPAAKPAPAKAAAPKLEPARASLQSKEKALAAAEVAEKFRFSNVLEESFTEETFKKFILGEATLAQLFGVTADQAYAFAEYAYTLYEQGRLREARQIFEALAIQNPADAYMHFMLGCIYHKLEMPEEAVEEFGNAIQLDPTNIAAFTNRGELLLQHGEFQDALLDLRSAIDLDKAGNDPFAMRARALAAATAEVMKAVLDKAAKDKKK